MNEDELIEGLAREAGMDWPDGEEFSVLAKKDEVRRFAALVAETCAREVEAVSNADAGNPYVQALRVGAERIRAMFQEPT